MLHQGLVRNLTDLLIRLQAYPMVVSADMNSERLFSGGNLGITRRRGLFLWFKNPTKLDIYILLFMYT